MRKVHLFTILFISLMFLTKGQEVLAATYGDTTAHGGNNANEDLVLMQVNIPVSGVATMLHPCIQADSGSATIYGGIYSDSGGLPGSLLVGPTSTTVSNTTTQFVDIDIPDTSLSAGNYWLAVSLTGTSNDVCDNTTTNAAREYNLTTVSSWPSSVSGSTVGRVGPIGYTVDVTPAVSSFTDNFSTTQYLSSDTNYSKLSGSQELQATGGLLQNGTCTTTSGHHALYRTTASFTDPDYDVSMYISNGSNAYYHFALLARVQDSQNFYFTNIEFGNRVYVGRVVNGSTSYTSVNSYPTNGDTVRLRVNGTSISVIWDDVIQATYNDSTFTSAGYAGFGMGNISGLVQSGAASNGCSSSQDYDNFEVNTTLAPLATAPIVSNPSHTNITSSTATLGATVDSDGGASITQRGICWGTSANPTGNCQTTSGTTGAFTQARTGLPAGTLIYYRGYAENNVGRTYTPDGKFYTPSTDQLVAIGTPSSVVDSGLGAGTVTYSNPSNATTLNNGYATASLGSSQRTRYLLGTNFGFNIPVGSTIDGIVVEGEYKTSTSVNIGMSGQLTKNGSQLVGGSKGTLYGNHLTEALDFLPAAMSKSDLWSTTWTPSEINASTFGVGLDTVVQSTGTSVSFDGMRILVYYTEPSTPAISSPTAVPGPTTATIGGNVTDQGASAVTERGVCYSTTDNTPELSEGGVTCQSTTGTTGIFTVDISGLTLDTLYYYSAYATNGQGTSYTTHPQTFTTLDGTAGSTTNPPQNTDSYKATFFGTANPYGYPTTAHFRYSTSDPGTCNDSFGARFPASALNDIPLGSGTENVEFSLSNYTLQPETTYYYCAITINQNGTSWGSVQNFTTPYGRVSGCDPDLGGDLTIDGSCTFPGTYTGVDAGTGITNTARITLNSGSILTLNQGQIIGRGSIRLEGGTISLASGGQITRGAVWVPDADTDGYLDNGTFIVSQSQPANTIRRNAFTGSFSYHSELTNVSTFDCDNTDNARYQNLTGYLDADGDTFTTGGAAQVCSGSSVVWSASYPYRASANGPDCNDSSAAPCVPNAPSVSAASQTQMNVSWSAATGPTPTSYDLQWCQGASCTPSTTITGVTSAYPHTGRTCGTTYGYRIRANNGSGDLGWSSTGYGTTSSCVSSPTLSNPTHSSVGATSATLGATVTSNGGASLTARGTCWSSTDSTPQLGEGGVNCLAQGGTTVSSFSHSRTGMPASTTIYYRGYATNSSGFTGYTATNSFTTSALLANGSVCSSGSECQSGNCYVDGDNDRYYPASGTPTCRASSALGSNDCNDSIGTINPGANYQTSARPDTGTWDWNCNGSIEANQTYSSYCSSTSTPTLRSYSDSSCTNIVQVNYNLRCTSSAGWSLPTACGRYGNTGVWYGDSGSGAWCAYHEAIATSFATRCR